MNASSTHFVLALSTVCAGLVNIQALILPAMPSSALPALTSLPWQLASTRPGHSDSERRISETATFLLPSFPGTELQLTRIADRHVEDLQVAAATQRDPKLNLKHRQLLALPSSKGTAMQVGVGKLQNQPALQACLKGQSAGLTKDVLQTLKPSAIAGHGPVEQFLLARRPLSNSCLLATIRAPGTATVTDLLKIWSDVQPRLQPLASQPAKSGRD